VSCTWCGFGGQIAIGHRHSCSGLATVLQCGLCAGAVLDGTLASVRQIRLFVAGLLDWATLVEFVV
jgi:hypothetical protein